MLWGEVNPEVRFSVHLPAEAVSEQVFLHRFLHRAPRHHCIGLDIAVNEGCQLGFGNRANFLRFEVSAFEQQ